MSAKKKLIPAVGFAKSKDIEQITVVDTEVEAIKDVVRETIQDADEVNALELVQDTNDNTNHESVQVNIMDSNNGSILSDEDSSTLSMSLCTILDPEFDNKLSSEDTADNISIQGNIQSSDSKEIDQNIAHEGLKGVKSSINEPIKTTTQETIIESSQDSRNNNEQVDEVLPILDNSLDVVDVTTHISKFTEELDMIQSSTLSSTLENSEVSIQENNKDIVKDNVVSNKQSISKLTYQIPSKSEPFSKRLVANVTPSQKIFVQEMSKKFENESGFVRFMISRFMEDIQFKENE